MGEFFVMSMRFNKCCASDFDLIARGENEAYNPLDGSTWRKTELYDFGWGNENGFYRLPLLGFDKLFDLVLNSKNEEDRYGAAAMILKVYGDKLLEKCEMLISDSKRSAEFCKVAKVFQLQYPFNRGSIDKKTYDQVQNDYERWKKIAEKAKLCL